MTDHLDRLVAYTGSPDVYDAPSVQELQSAIEEIKRLRSVEPKLRGALREAYDAGVRQGEDSATAYEWGSSPSQSADQSFTDLFEEWNTGPIQDLMKTVK
ncbi:MULTISPECIES: hypothetical protein [unclassified Roseibium]|uniref:hypothetical protein n=1 Tax=unclassified Roseibium TaxID=2629323 RepID=UPI00273DE2F5|nr:MULTISPECIES: hypothetical protein [unclassified Roseibium]